MTEENRDCSCAACVAACQRTPGWFAPGEAERTAALLGMEFDAFRTTYLICDYWVGGAKLWSPRKVGVDVGRDTASWGGAFRDAPCIFLDDQGRCKIHAAKPWECRHTMACEPQGPLRPKINEMWLAAGAPLGTEGYVTMEVRRDPR